MREFSVKVKIDEEYDGVRDEINEFYETVRVNLNESEVQTMVARFLEEDFFETESKEERARVRKALYKMLDEFDIMDCIIDRYEDSICEEIEEGFER